jgi:two-component system NtrC family sensor kinase
MPDPEPIDNVRKLTDLGHLSAGVGHHVINAFSAIVSNAELLRLKSGQGSAVAEPAALAETIIQSALGAATVARRLIDYTRSVTSIEPGRGVLAPASIELDHLVAEFVDEVRAAAPTGVAWVTDLAPVPAVQGHAQQLKAMLGYLARNAWEAMPSQHGAIAISTAPDTRGWVVVEMRDSGEGMTRETLERAVEPFFTTRHGHLGVGLSIANGIWRRHRGTLFLRSQPGDGTVVRLCIEPMRA